MVDGECPTFETGTVTVGGLGGISLQVGERQQRGALVFYWHPELFPSPDRLLVEDAQG